ncbi:hypothetical protein SISNIDRAFT_481804 [Sistotremastrum niveocremeum HHB9708]|uniref:Uncharacterized protein n=1 Tax=Sistotremastrum niveocremeum HHB9708 TaxID=1314777 RepID=A0A164ZPT8_9AGAM|nr:hypothetical protein SISNIDRAFT_481804 [Sistotremastrum niveocremeum HHB9708]
MSSEDFQLSQPLLTRSGRPSSLILSPGPLSPTPESPNEKSPLPSIIVTPCSPSCATDYQVAFIPSYTSKEESQQPQPPSGLLSSLASKIHPVSTRLRFAVVLAVPLFVVATHFLVHQFVAREDHELNGHASSEWVFGG